MLYLTISVAIFLCFILFKLFKEQEKYKKLEKDYVIRLNEVQELRAFTDTLQEQLNACNNLLIPKEAVKKRVRKTLKSNPDGNDAE